MNKIAKGLTILSETTRGGILCDIVFKTAGGVGGKVALVEKFSAIFVFLVPPNILFKTGGGGGGKVALAEKYPATCCMLNFRPSALPPPHL